jgi:membrane protein
VIPQSDLVEGNPSTAKGTITIWKGEFSLAKEAFALFSFYAANFGTFNETYGSLGAAIGFMTWLWISAIAILLGAELNAEMEHQTKRDTTTGGPKPLGARGAKMADTLGAAR